VVELVVYSVDLEVYLGLVEEMGIPF